MPANLDLAERLEKQISFVREIDKLKQVFRQTPLMDRSRAENDAEHSWHMSVMALVLFEYAEPEVDLLRVLKMLLIHDIVEIDAGDTFLYDAGGAADQAEREEEAADRIFGLLPDDQAREFRSVWGEFEERATPDAMFARALDRFQPLLHNYYTQGGTWQQHGVTADQVRERKVVIADGSAVLWTHALELIEDGVRKGYLSAGTATASSD